MTPKTLFTLTFIIMFSTYFYIFGEQKTVEIVLKEYLSIFALIFLILIYIFFKIKLKDYQTIDFNKNNISLKSSILFFLLFEVIDYISEDGFMGMISLWFFYWIMGLIALFAFENINYYKNYKLIKKSI